MKIGCVIQGNIRVPLQPILAEILPKFDVTVVSAWKDDEKRCPPGIYERILSDVPVVRGVTNRNLQRLSTAKGIECLAELGCTHVLKWRTDLLPTRLEVDKLMRLSRQNEGNGIGGRIVTGGFRHLSLEPDWFSSFPDLYSFSSIEAARLLWTDEGFDYSRQYNMPEKMIAELGIEAAGPESFIYQGREYSTRGIYAYDAHTEFYALFRDRLEKKLGLSLDHPTIIRNYFSLIPDNALGICWHDPRHPLLFRPIRQGYHLNWWKAGQASEPKVYPFESMQKPVISGAAKRLFWGIPPKLEMARQLANYLLFRPK